MDIDFVESADPRYPQHLRARLGSAAPERLAALGNTDLLTRPKLALFCSTRCPGTLILQTYDLAQRLRQAPTAVAGGFHTPVEKTCLEALLRGPGAVIICPAARLSGARIPAAYRQPLTEARMLLLSPFPETLRRATAETATARNRFVAGLAERIFIAYAAPESRTEALCRELLAVGREVWTLDNAANANLVALGVRAPGVAEVVAAAEGRARL
jgi:predicted Rossmann fold nucleotide-binding protein DprA/Smf involved in DNA uptake